MSWWVLDTVSINEDGDECLCDIQCDAAADLPAANQISTIGYTIVRGSTALDLATGDRYIMGSSGSWVQQPSQYQLDLAGYATQSWVSGELAGYVDTTTYSTDQAAQDAAITALSNAGSKNRLKIAGTTTTHRGITFTVNSDGSITANGANDGNGASIFDINSQVSLQLPNGSYILSGCPSGGSTSGYMMDITQSGGASFKDIGSGVDFEVGGSYTVLLFRIVISRNLSVNNLVFYPMIRVSAITDSTYQPYAPTNRELYEMILALQ